MTIILPEKSTFHNMIAIVYEFWVKEGQQDALLSSWKTITDLYLSHCNSLGSRLHHAGGLHYVAYAQWPSAQVRERANLSHMEAYTTASQIMTDACSKITSSEALTPVYDLLKT